MHFGAWCDYPKNGPICRILDSIRLLSAKYTYGISATLNISTPQRVSHLANFIGTHSSHSCMTDAQNFIVHYVCRNTYEPENVPIVFRSLPVKMTSSERGIYQEALMSRKSRSIALQLCSYFSPDMADTDAKSSLARIQKSYESNVTKAEEGVQEAEAYVCITKDDVERKEDLIKKATDKLDGCNTSLNRFLDCLNAVTKATEGFDCSICWDSIEACHGAITKCSHIYCIECITRAVNTRRSCPLCRSTLSIRDVYNSAAILANSQDETDITMKYGSKIQAVLKFLQELMASCPSDRSLYLFSLRICVERLRMPL